MVVVAVLVAVVFAAPLGYLVARTATTDLDHGALITSERTLRPLARTLGLATGVALAASVLGTSIAWITTRTDLPFRRAVRVVATMPLVIPSFVGSFALLAALGPHGVLSDVPLVGSLPRPTGFFGALGVLTLLTYPYVLLPVAARLRALPASLEEGARLLGRGPWRVFATVVIPQIRAAIMAGALLVFLYVVSDFGAVSMLRYRTLSVTIFENRLVNQPVSLTLGLLLGLIAVAVVAAERWLVRRDPLPPSMSSSQPVEVRLGRWKVVAGGAMGAVIVAALVVPISALATWAWRGLTTDVVHIGIDDLSLAALARPSWNSASVSLIAAIVAVGLLWPLAFLTTRSHSRIGSAAGIMVTSGFALPGLVIALSLVFWALQSDLIAPFYQTMPLLVLGYVVHFGAQALQAANVAVGAVPRRFDDAARLLGASRARRLLTVDLPLMLPGLAAGAGLVLLSAMKELPATLLLAPTGFDTLATRIWSAAEDGFLAEAGLASMVLVAVSSVLTWLLVIRRADRLA